MKKKLLLTLFTICIFIAVIIPVSAYADAPAVSVMLNGSNITYSDYMGYPFIDSNNRTLVPLRATMEACDCNVDWEETTSTATVEKNNIKVSVPIGESFILINGEKKEIDTAAVINNSRTFLPIRAVLEAFGYSLGYDGSTRTVKILSFDDTNGKLPMNVHFIDVGQGDCELIDFGEYEILIDGGSAAYGDKVVSYIKPYIDGNIELYIATHPDYDHIGAGAAIINAYQIDEIIQSGYSKDTESDTNFRQAISDKQVKTVNDDDFTIDLGNGAFLNIIETGDDYEEVNNNSVVAMLTYGKIKVLFTGDMETEAETNALWKFSDVDVLKAGHHGSNSSSSDEFLSTVKPEFSVISCAENNGAYHPHKRALQRMLNAGSTIIGTFKSGDLVMTANQWDYYWNKVEPLTLNDAGIYHIPIP